MMEATWLFSSAKKGEYESILSAMQAGVDPDLTDEAGRTLAHMAAAAGHTKILKLLISSGSDMNAKDLTGNSMAHEAARQGQLDVLKLLKKVNVALDEKNKLGETPQSVAKAPHIISYIGYVSGRAADVNDLRTQSRNGSQRKKPVGTKSKKEYLKWKRERTRIRLQNESTSDKEIEQVPSTGQYGNDIATSQRFSRVGSNRPEKKNTLTETAFEYFKDMVPVHDKSYMSFKGLPGQYLVKSSSEDSASESDSGDRQRSLKHSKEQILYFPRSQLDELGWSEEGRSLSFPQRPAWKGIVANGEELNILEEKAFSEWQQNIQSRFQGDRLSSYEKNLNYWRQLWRVMERSDICLIIVDARNPLLHLNDSLYTYATETMGLKAVIVLNKSDLVPRAVINEWTQYLKNMYPDVEVVPIMAGKGGERFTMQAIFEAVLNIEAWPDSHKTVGEIVEMNAQELVAFRQRINTVFEGKCLVVPENGNRRAFVRKGSRSQRRESRREKKSTKAGLPACKEDEEVDSSENHDFDSFAPKSANAGQNKERPIVVCVLGEPNVGKSSTINSLLGIKKMSVSSHPGHTKHYQTYYLTPKLMLCDCPGLVFPRLDVPHPLQVLFGSYPISQCRDPYSVVQYLAERIWPRIHTTMKLVNAEAQAGNDICSQGSDETHWSVKDVCEAVATRKKWYTTRGGREDTYRAANWILRNALAGKEAVRLAFWPPQQLPWQEKSKSIIEAED